MYLCGANKMQHTQTFHNFQFTDMTQTTALRDLVQAITEGHEMKNKTVMQHIAQAVVEGHDWAPAAMINLVKSDVMNKYHISEVPFLFRALHLGFVWGDTPEGNDYWYEIYLQLREQGK